MIFGAIIGALTGNGICVEDVGYNVGTGLQSAAIIHDATMWASVQTAMMLWQRYANGAISDIRRDLANRRMVMAEAALAHAKLAWAKESAFVSETMAVPSYNANYSRASTVGSYVEEGWEYADASFDARTAKLGLTVSQCDDARTARGMAIAKADLIANAMRAEEARTLQLNDRRFSRQLSVLAMGHKKLQVAMKMGQLGESGANAVRKAVDTAFGVGMATWGYEQNRWRAGESERWRDRYVAPTTIPTNEDRSARFTPSDSVYPSASELAFLAQSEFQVGIDEAQAVPTTRTVTIE